MKSSDIIKEGNVLWRVDWLGEFDAPSFSFNLQDAHKVGLMYSNKPYIITMIQGDTLNKSIKGK
jgi:hypothetical protein